MSWSAFIDKIKPDGKAFRSILNTKIFYEVIANAYQMAIDYVTLQINDQVWFVNDNFDPVPWEARYGIIPSQFATLSERRIIVKSYMLYPQSGNRLSKDYMQSVLNERGYSAAILDYNPTGANTGFLHVNDSADEKVAFTLGSLTYNSFIVSGDVTAVFYNDIIKTLMSLKPLQIGFYDNLRVLNAVAYDNDYALAIDDNFAIAITNL
jgi:hypothetical protein